MAQNYTPDIYGLLDAIFDTRFEGMQKLIRYLEGEDIFEQLEISGRDEEKFCLAYMQILVEHYGKIRSRYRYAASAVLGIRYEYSILQTKLQRMQKYYEQSASGEDKEEAVSDNTLFKAASRALEKMADKLEAAKKESGGGSLGFAKTAFEDRDKIYAELGYLSATEESSDPAVRIHSYPPLAENMVPRDTILNALYDGFAEGARIQILYGMPGIGKTQAALQYAEEYKDGYDIIFFLNADTEATLRESCHKFLVRINASEQNGSYEQQKAAFKNYLGNHDKWLLIFDNADYLTRLAEQQGKQSRTGDILSDYFPQSSGTGHILLTSRYDADWQGANRIPVALFSEDKAVSYLNMVSGLTGQDDDAAALADELGYLPLALLYAGAYIRQCHLISYSEYLKSYMSYGRDPLDEELYDTLGTVDAMPLYRTLSLILSNLEKPCGNARLDRIHEAVIQFLKICAFINPDDISLIPYIEGSAKVPEPLRSIMESEINTRTFSAELTKYSLFRYDSQNDTYSLHRLLQEFMRDSTGSEVPQWVVCAYNVIIGQVVLSMGDTTYQRYTFIRSLFPHVQQIMTYLAALSDDRTQVYYAVEVFSCLYENANIARHENQPDDFLMYVDGDCQTYENELQLYDAVGLDTSYLAAVRHMLLWERYNILGGDHAEDHFDLAFSIAENILRKHLTVSDFIFSKTQALHALYVFSYLFRYNAETASPENVWQWLRLIYGSINTMAGLELPENYNEYRDHTLKESLSDVYYRTSDYLAELLGRPILTTMDVPQWTITDGMITPTIRQCFTLHYPHGTPAIKEYPFTILISNHFVFLRDTKAGGWFRPVNARPELKIGCDYTLTERDMENCSSKGILPFEKTGTVIALLPEDYQDREKIEQFVSGACIERETVTLDRISISDESDESHAPDVEYYMNPSEEDNQRGLEAERLAVKQAASSVKRWILPHDDVYSHNNTPKRQ